MVDTSDGSEDDAAPGWDAIDAACLAVYPDQPEPLHYGTLIKYTLGGPDPLDGISVYRADDPVSHWHYVTYGFSDLYDTDEPEPTEDGSRPLSDYGFEVTFRLLANLAEDPPQWPLVLLQSLARYVFGTGNAFAKGHHVNLGSDNPIDAVCFVVDDDLGVIDSRRGTVSFLQAVAITHDELETISAWDTHSFVALLKSYLPKAVTEVGRRSLLEYPEIRQRIDAAIEAEGSSQSRLFVPHVVVTTGNSPEDDFVVELDEASTVEVLKMLPLRLRFDEPILVTGSDPQRQDWVSFRPVSQGRFAQRKEYGDLWINLDPLGLDALLTTLRPVAGRYRLAGLDGVVFQVIAGAG